MDLSILIPARNEEFLRRTIEDILEHREADTEIIVILDGAWADPPIEDDDRVTLVYHPVSIGQRAATNEAARMAQGDYVMKCDAHCSFGQGFDRILIEDCGPTDTVMPEQRNLHAFDWECKTCGKRTYQGPRAACCSKCDGIEFDRVMVWEPRPNTRQRHYRFDRDLHFQYWRQYKQRAGDGHLVESMSLLGACWMMRRDRYFEIEPCDENHGSWGQMGTEIGCKTHLSGGRLLTNRNTWYAHLFRTQPGFGFPYPMSGSAQQTARDYSQWLWNGNNWAGQVYPLSAMLEKYWPIPGWTDEDYEQQKARELEVDRPGIYSINNVINGKLYIGSATSLSRRFSEHVRSLRRNGHDNPHLQNSWNKHGEDAFTFNILYFCSEVELIEVEQVFLDTYAEELGWEKLYNIARIAGSRLGVPHSEETKTLMSETRSGDGNGFAGRRHTPESIRKMRQSHLGQTPWNLGRPWSEEVKAKIGAANTGNVAWNRGLTKETDERVQEYADKLSGGHIWEEREHPRGFADKTHTEETKERIRQAMQRKVKTRRRGPNGQFLSGEDVASA